MIPDLVYKVGTYFSESDGEKDSPDKDNIVAFISRGY